MKRSQSGPARVAAAVMAVAGLAAMAGCEQILGLDDYHLAEGAGGGGGGVCTPGTTLDCYAGPAGTEGVGICKVGKQTCNAEGTAYGACEGEVLPQPEVCGNVDDEDCNGTACGQAIWSKIAGDGESQVAKSIGTDKDGNVFLLGSFAGVVDLGGGPLVSAGGLDIVVAKFDSSGKHVWSKRYGDAEDQSGEELSVASDGSVIIGGYLKGSLNWGGGVLQSTGDKDAFVIKLGPSGDGLWSRRFGDSSAQEVQALAVDSVGDVVVVGTFYGSIDLGSGPSSSMGVDDVFIVKLAGKTGLTSWSNVLGGAEAAGRARVAIDPADGVVLAGALTGTVNFGGGNLTAQGWDDIYVAKYDWTGKHVWSKRFGDSGRQQADAVAVDQSGNILVFGQFAGSIDFGGEVLSVVGDLTEVDTYLVKFDAMGERVWSKQFEAMDEYYEQLHVVVRPVVNSVLIVGGFAGNVSLGGAILQGTGSPFAKKLFVAEYDKDGNHIWSEQFGEQGHHLTRDVDFKGDAILLAGETSGTIDFGDGTLTSAGKQDLFLTKLSP